MNLSQSIPVFVNGVSGMKMSSLNITQRTTLKQWKTISLLMGVIAQLFLAGDWYGFAAVM